MFILKRDVTNPDEKPLLKFSKFGENSNSLVSLSARIISQVPDQYGKFEERDNVGPWESVKVNGQLVTFHANDSIFTYTWVEVPN
ncbi:MAG TPA: hypothetical protein VNX68_06340 [Nitrosopumilaceae archaeon]|jgi:hypothetical protein|nr:hypothetical protein [Nitrosopumilaceae archaeon]